MIKKKERVNSDGIKDNYILDSGNTVKNMV
jgi:hypothetical protein